MKRFTKLLSVILVAALLLCTVSAGVAYAETAKTVVEAENNNEYAKATAIAFGDEAKGKLATSDDVDYYKFTVKESGTIAVNFIHPKTDSSYGYFKITLLKVADNKETEITSAVARGVDDNLSLARCALVEGTYYVRIESDSVSVSDEYTLTVSINTSQLSEKESNDKALDASTMLVSTSATDGAEAKDYIYIGSIGTEADVDYFTFNIPSRGYIYVYLYNSPIDNNPIDYKVSLCSFTEGTSKDGVPAEFGHFISDADEQTNVSPSYGVEARNYYLRVEKSGNYLQGNEYQIKIKFTPFEAFEVETNNVPTAASQFAAKDDQQNLSIYGASSLFTGGDDEDWFKITYNAGSVEKLELAFSALSAPATASWTIDIYKKDVVYSKNAEEYAQYRYGETLTGKGGAETRITLSEEVRGSGEFYVRVVGDSTAFSTNDYLLVPIFTRGEAPEAEGSVFDGLKEYFDSLGTIDWTPFLDNFQFMGEFMWSDVPLTLMSELVNIVVFILNFFSAG